MKEDKIGMSPQEKKIRKILLIIFCKGEIGCVPTNPTFLVYFIQAHGSYGM